jgi:AAA domain
LWLVRGWWIIPSALFLFKTTKTIYMQLQTAQRKRAKIKMGLQGPSGAGKTYSSLLIAYGLCNDWNKIAVVDTENHSAELYAHLGAFNTLQLSAPFTPEKYMQAIDVCEKAGMEVLVIDSVTHEWENLLDYHTSLQGNSFTNWGRVTPRHNEFVRKILQSSMHIISTIRTKQDYVLNERNGKMVPEKVGLKTVQRDGLEYEFTLVFDIDMKNHAIASKDRTGLFFGQPEQKLSVETGKQINDWCNSGAAITVDDVSRRIGDVISIQELLSLYQQYPQFKEVLKPEFEQRKRQIIIAQEIKTELLTPQTSSNGIH